MSELPILIRPYELDDQEFIFNSWLKSFRESPQCEHLNDKIYYSEHHRVIEGILDYATTLVAVNPDDPSHIMGYLVYVPWPFVLHYCFTKSLFRKLGVQRKLLAHAMQQTLADSPHDELIIYSHWTFHVKKLLKNYPLQVYNPYLQQRRLRA